MSEKTNDGYSRYSRPGKEGPDLGTFVEAVADDAREWFEIQKDATKLELSEKLGKFVTTVVAVLFTTLIVATVLVMWFIALALWLGELLGDAALGFVAAGGVFVVLGVIFMAIWKNGLKEKVLLSVINAIHDED